jgi:hypothetical protein
VKKLTLLTRVVLGWLLEARVFHSLESVIIGDWQTLGE